MWWLSDDHGNRSIQQFSLCDFNLRQTCRGCIDWCPSEQLRLGLNSPEWHHVNPWKWKSFRNNHAECVAKDKNGKLLKPMIFTFVELDQQRSLIVLSWSPLNIYFPRGYPSDYSCAGYSFQKTFLLGKIHQTSTSVETNGQDSQESKVPASHPLACIHLQ